MRILHKDLHLWPYKIQVVQKLKNTDFANRLQFSHWFLDKFDENNNFPNSLIMSDEAHFDI